MSKDAEAISANTTPNVHTGRFAPEVAPTLQTGTIVMTVSALELLVKR